MTVAKVAKFIGYSLIALLFAMAAWQVFLHIDPTTAPGPSGPFSLGWGWY